MQLQYCLLGYLHTCIHTACRLFHSIYIGESFIERVFNETIDAGNTEQSFLPVALITNNNIVECTKVLGLILTTSEACKTTTSMAEVNVTSDDGKKPNTYGCRK